MSSTKTVKFVDPKLKYKINNNNSTNDSRVVLNVGGMRFETQRATLKKLPATRLSKLTPQLSYYDPVLNEYFFDRHPGVFSQILNYYRTGKLHYPTNVCGPLFEDELSYWGIQREEVEPCCWMTYTKHRSTQETLQTLDSLELDTVRSTQNDLIKKFDWEDDVQLAASGKLPMYRRLRMIIWQLFEEPRSSVMAKIIALISILFILLSITTFILRTLTIFEIAEYDFIDAYIDNNTTEKAPVQKPHRKNTIYGFDIIEWIYLLSTIRVARMFKLIYFHPRLRVITTTISHSSTLLILSIIFCMVAIMIAGSALYFVEHLSNPSESQIISVIDGIWLALTTVTTLGFGDIVPKSLAGMILGAITTIFGVLIIDLPMPIVNEIFDNYNRHLLARQQLPKQRRRITPAVIPRKIKPLAPTNGHEH